MDAKAEAEKRYPIPEGRWAPKFDGFVEQPAFLAGAAWALREFGDMLDVEATNGEWSVERDLALLSWASEARHIADGIEEGT